LRIIEAIGNQTSGKREIALTRVRHPAVLAGQKLGIKEVDDGIWLVSFMHYDLGYIDLEQRTLQTIDNPFGTRLSPMS
ncbi:transposase, partial [Rhizobium leucaenae]|uniref:transposase n=1 Tax=Rhizobium leucaenae TaxID=29450 RepID=UPI001AED99A0